MSLPSDSAGPIFDVYGFRFAIHSSSQWAQESLAHDFAFFRTSTAGEARIIEILDEEPKYEHLPACDASVYTPRNVVYRNGATAYLDYNGKGLGIHDTSTGSFRIVSRDPHMLYEAVYLFLLSQIGQYLDRKKLHRIHALGVSLNGRAILALLPMGGGKSTLGAHLLQRPEIKLLSDDSPFVDSKGHLHAFPLHLGLLPNHEGQVPEQHRRMIRRMEFGPKILVNYSYFADRVCASAEPGIVFLGRRSLSPECRIERAGMTAGIRAAVTNCVVGLGLFHGLEFILESSALELASKASVAYSRLTNCLQLLRRSEVYYVHLGRDPETNARCVTEFAHKTFA
jgi:hypothetical protein